QELEISNYPIRFIEEESVPSDAPVVDQTWRYVNKTGGPDRRFNSNKQLPICLYGELCFRSGSGLNFKLNYSNPVAADRLCRVIDVLHRSPLELPKTISYARTAKRWPTLTFLACASVFAATQSLFLPYFKYPNFSDQSSSIPVSVQSIGERPTERSLSDLR